MDNPSLVAVARQAGLIKDMRIVANNLANVSTTGFRRESVVFSEIVDQLAVDGGAVSQSGARVRTTDFAQGAVVATGGAFDFAIEGEGFFLLETELGPRLTRAGAFARNSQGELVAADGARVLGEGGATLFFPVDAKRIDVATDGTISADGQPLGRLALVTVADQTRLLRESGQRFEALDGFNEAEDAKLLHGFLERSNVDPVREITRMIEVQRAYELGQSFLDKEDERIRQSIRVMGAPT